MTRGLEARLKDTQSPCNGSGLTSAGQQTSETLLTQTTMARRGEAASTRHSKGNRRDTRQTYVFYPKVSNMREDKYFLCLL